jgi:glyoxylase-like metal-dependent hydrolase (beta-lactamase superfamily II)
MAKWFVIEEAAQNVFVIEEPGHAQSYLVNGADRSALIDTGTGLSNIREALRGLLKDDLIVLNTHWHFDHVGGNVLFHDIGISEIEKPLVEMDLPNSALMDLYITPCVEEGIPLPLDFVPEEYMIKGSHPAFLINDGDLYDLGGRTLQALFTPGHTRGSISFFDHLTGSLFCGDLVYQGTLYAHFEDSDFNDYHRSMKMLCGSDLPFKGLFPGHNAYPLRPEFIHQVQQGFEEIQGGKIPAEINEDWGKHARGYVFNDFSVLTKMPGDPGIRLFDFT